MRVRVRVRVEFPRPRDEKILDVFSISSKTVSYTHLTLPTSDLV